MKERLGCLSALPTFLAEAGLWDGIFSSRGKLAESDARKFARRYLASHRYGVLPAKYCGEPLDGPIKLVLELALSLLERGLWTQPSWQVEQRLAAHAEQALGWEIVPATSAAGDLRLRLRTRVEAEDLLNVHLPHPVQGEVDIEDLVTPMCELIDAGSPGEEIVLREVLAKALPPAIFSLLIPQREVATMGLDAAVFVDQRVDFAIESYRGARLVIEVDGGQHEDSDQKHLDERRDAALLAAGWEVWRIRTDELDDLAALREQLQKRLEQCRFGSVMSGRNQAVASIFWAATAVARIQALAIHALLEGFVPAGEAVTVHVNSTGTQADGLAIEDLNATLGHLGALYGVSVPVFVEVDAPDAVLVIDVDVFNPAKPVTSARATVAWSRSANRGVVPLGRLIQVKPGSPRYLAQAPEIETLDALIRNLFRKDGFRRDADGHSDQAIIAVRALMGKDVIGLLPTGAGKSLPYMLAGLLLPGVTLYVGPLVSLIQDQAERLMEAGIEHVAYITSAVDVVAKAAILGQVQAAGLRFLLVSPERFLTKPFLSALNNQALSFASISQVVIDECHCVSEWGHDFRPAYLSLGRIARERTKRLGIAAPLVGLTGTASTIVLSDVLRELGIDEPEACVRASSLDRKELSIRCAKVVFQDKREQQVEQLARDFLARYAEPSDGILVFCPFRGGRSVGVLSVAAHLTRELPGVDIRFYSGGKSPWADFAVFNLRRKASQLTPKQIEDAVPIWARKGNAVMDWDAVKQSVQREFIGGGKDNYRVLVATKAFGMGIDKPSIRSVVHVVSPTSPEAYYQEIGRAGRDRKPSEAVLLFCDNDPRITDDLLNPEHNHEQAQEIYRKYTKDNPYGGGDFTRTFYFQDKSFAGLDAEAEAIYEVARTLHGLLKAGRDSLVPFDTASASSVDEQTLKTEQAIVRLIHLGVADGYTKDYRSRVFEIEVNPDWAEIRTQPGPLAGYFADKFRAFVGRYALRIDHAEAAAIEAAQGLEGIYSTAARMLMGFVYSNIESQRRQATRAMLELARLGLEKPEEMRGRLLNYLQVSMRYTAVLEALGVNSSPADWLSILLEPQSPQDLAELHGASQRVIASYPSHPGLLFITALSRPFATAEDLRRSEEEAHACISHSKEIGQEMEAVSAAFLAFRQQGWARSMALNELVDDIVGNIYLDLGKGHEALVPFLASDGVRKRWLAAIVHKSVIDSVSKASTEVV